MHRVCHRKCQSRNAERKKADILGMVREEVEAPLEEMVKIDHQVYI